MTHSYAGYVKHGYTTWLRHVRLCRLYQIRLRRVITLHTELRHSASLRHPRHSSHHSHITPPRHSSRHSSRHSHVIPSRHSSRHSRVTPRVKSLTPSPIASLHRVTSRVTFTPRVTPRVTPASMCSVANDGRISTDTTHRAVLRR